MANPTCSCGECKLCIRRVKEYASWTARRHRVMDEMDSIKLEAGCCRCGYKEHPAALEFHHTDPSTKTDGVARLYMGRRERLDEELAKCEVICANCHNIEHYGR